MTGKHLIAYAIILLVAFALLGWRIAAGRRRRRIPHHERIDLRRRDGS